MSRSSRLSRSYRLAAVAALLAAVGVPTATAPAHAVGTEVVCTATETIAYQPGLKLVPTPQKVSATRTYSNCDLLSEFDISSGSSSGTASQSLSCADALQAGAASETITWNTGKTSTFTYNRTVSHVAGQTVVTNVGTITAGEFEGQGAKSVFAGPTADTLQCLKEGITERAGAGTLTILAL
ncbi:hypothetical protein [Streptomyces violens]|uniref:hypothetical protein n=1 Tax=Streptomyces violens TaxID=66377 RepID=UPI0004C04DBB|nr:hypothetical protein [Streptomyces violens]